MGAYIFYLSFGVMVPTYKHREIWDLCTCWLSSMPIVIDMESYVISFRIVYTYAIFSVLLCYILSVTSHYMFFFFLEVPMVVSKG